MSNLQFYQDLELIEQPEVPLSAVWSKIYTQLHLAFAEFKNKFGYQPIGISFPDYGNQDFPLGKKLRLFADSEEELKKLDVSKWLSRLVYYVNIQNIHPVPTKRVKGYAIFSRKEIKSNPEAIARRRCKRHPELTFETALAQISTKQPTFTNLPFVLLSSLSSGHHFKLFIERKNGTSLDNAREFSSYGLSNQNSVPIF